MNNTSLNDQESWQQTARYITSRIDQSNKSQQQIAMEAGLGTADDVAMIKTGATRLPIGKIARIAKALEVDPVELLTMCLKEYFPETWESISPFLETLLTSDELVMVKALRSAVGGPYVMALTSEERKPLNEFIEILRTPALIH